MMDLNNYKIQYQCCRQVAESKMILFPYCVSCFFSVIVTYAFFKLEL